MERLLKFKFSTATLGEKKANVKREVAFALLSPSSFDISANFSRTTQCYASMTLSAARWSVWYSVGVGSGRLDRVSNLVFALPN
jgi:hypothetical protein